jgi:2',3'-cyclic-nucleotide 2'-phosphodiesterase (5'-nucleotidase family)
VLNLGLVQQVPVRRGALAVLALAALASCARACDGAQRAREEPAAARGPAAHADAGRAPLRLVLIGDLEGVLEPCGCTTRPLGGVDRLAAAVAAARRGAQEAIVVAAGDLFTSAAQGARAEPRAQDALQTDALSAVLARIGVDVLAPGAADRARAPEAVAALARTTRAAMLGTGPHPPALDAMAPRAVVRRAVDVGVVTAGSGAPAEVAAAAAQADALRGAGAALVIAFVSGDAEAAAAVAAGTRADFVVASGVAEGRRRPRCCRAVRCCSRADGAASRC